MSYQTITRKGTFDAGHRVMNERMKCFNLHGHTYLYELQFEFSKSKDIGYPIDFKEIKRVGCQWIDDHLDHGMLINPKDMYVIDVSDKLNSKKWIMSLNGEREYCNPTVENISKEVFLAISYLLDDSMLRLERVRLYETPNCYSDCFGRSLSQKERDNFIAVHEKALTIYKNKLGTLEYDDRL